jgi:DNA-binding response OmpR family regulator
MGNPPEPDVPRTLLITDDEDHVRTLLCRLFQRAGHRALSAPNGRDALAFLADTGNPIDLLITDVSMPGVSGPELIREARRLRPGLKVICISGRIKDPSVSEGIHYVPKPFTLTGLVEKVRAILG